MEQTIPGQTGLPMVIHGITGMKKMIGMTGTILNILEILSLNRREMSLRDTKEILERSQIRKN